MFPKYLSIKNKNILYVILLNDCNNIAFFSIYYTVILLQCFIVKSGHLNFITSYNNDSAEFRKRFAILKCFNEIILQYICNLIVLYGYFHLLTTFAKKKKKNKSFIIRPYKNFVIFKVFQYQAKLV